MLHTLREAGPACARCMMDFRPRHFQGGTYVLLANLAEIAMVELERETYLDTSDRLQRRFPAVGPVPITNPLRRLSNMSHLSNTPPLSGRSSGCLTSDMEDAGSATCGDTSSKATLRKAREAMQAAAADRHDVDLSELAEAWWISTFKTSRPGDAAAMSLNLRNQLREQASSRAQVRASCACISAPIGSTHA